MTADGLRKKYLEFFVSKGHAVIPGASLIPEHDPSVLFTTAGMHPLVPFLLGEKHPAGKRITNIQKCVRTDDIDEVGDFIHHTFFEMMGSWSLGDYFKKEIIEWSYEFMTSSQWLGLEPQNLGVSVFEGDSDAPVDQEAYEAWRALGIPEKRIAKLPKKANWWGPAGITGPCGPDTEMVYWTGDDSAVPVEFDPEDVRWVEIGNDVFMQYNKTAQGSYELLEQKNVDVGWGLDRMLAVTNGYYDDYKTEQFAPIIEEIERLSGKVYQSTQQEDDYAIRVIADHIRAAAFLLAEKLEPSNTEQGYILRRLIRRAVRYGRQIGIKDVFLGTLADVVAKKYGQVYPELRDSFDFIQERIAREEEKFGKTLGKGLIEANKIKEQNLAAGLESGHVTGAQASTLYQSYGFPKEMIKEEFSDFDEEEFEKELKKHQELSRAGSGQKFKGGLADHSEQTTKYHTATHLLQAALRQILGKHVRQMGSNITAERMRFDFSHPGDITHDQIKAVEALVNEKIKKDLPVQKQEMSNKEADQSGVLSVPRVVYGALVSVYSVTDGDIVFSKEKCGGPHVSRTRELGEFKIVKLESIGQGIKRIKAVLV